MQTEIEAMFADVDHDTIREKLENLGGICVQPMRDMRRALVQTPAMRDLHAFLRVRDEGDKITLTYKQVNELSLHGVEEAEIKVDDFDTTVAILKASGLEPTTYQESRRETWQLNDVEVVLDEWPWIETYIEVEGKNEADVRSVVSLLGLSWDKAQFGGVNTLYNEKYPKRTVRGVIEIPQVRFGDPVPAAFLGEAS